MASTLLLHSVTDQQLAAVIQQPPHALLLVGPRGTGKRTVARWYAAQVLHVSSLNSQPYVLELDGRDEAVSIEQIRALRQFLHRKTTGTAGVRRACLLYDVGTMTSEAANALLKTLEEPPEDTIIVLTADTLAHVPRTIRSRTQAITIRPVGKQLAERYFEDKSYTISDIARAYHISGGRAALMAVLLEQRVDHPLMQAIDEAKQLLQASVFDRLCHVDQYAKDKVRTQQLLYGLERITYSVTQTAALQANRARLDRARRSEQAVQQAVAALAHNASPKLVLTSLCINM